MDKFCRTFPLVKNINLINIFGVATFGEHGLVRAAKYGTIQKQTSTTTQTCHPIFTKECQLTPLCMMAVRHILPQSPFEFVSDFKTLSK